MSTRSETEVDNISDDISDDTILDLSSSEPERDLTQEEINLINKETLQHNLRILSYSALTTKHSCPRKFELQRMLPRPNYGSQDENGHLAFGTVVGNGIQEYLISGSLSKAIFRAFLDWTDYLDSEKGLKNKKTFWHAIQAIQKFQEVRHGPLGNYNVAYFEGKPATELGYEIDCENGFKVRGSIDVLLIHKLTKEYLVLECKTTGARFVHDAMYRNSAQAVGYGVVIDSLVEREGQQRKNSYTVLYPVYKTYSCDWEVFSFAKTSVQRTLWIQDLLLDIEDITRYTELEYFPMRGESCYHYNKACDYFGICSMKNSSLLSPGQLLEKKVDDPDKFPMKFSLTDLISAQESKSNESSI